MAEAEQQGAERQLALAEVAALQEKLAEAEVKAQAGADAEQNATDDESNKQQQQQQQHGEQWEQLFHPNAEAAIAAAQQERDAALAELATLRRQEEQEEQQKQRAEPQPEEAGVSSDAVMAVAAGGGAGGGMAEVQEESVEVQDLPPNSARATHAFGAEADGDLSLTEGDIVVYLFAVLFCDLFARKPLRQAHGQSMWSIRYTLPD